MHFEGKWTTFKPHCSFPGHIQQVFPQMAPKQYSSVTADGFEYRADMAICAGSCSGLPEFMQISQIVAVNSGILFVCKTMTEWYIEHVQLYDLCSSRVTSLCVIQISELYQVTL